MDRKSNHKFWLAIWVVFLAVGQTTCLEASNGPYASNPDPADGAEIEGEVYPELPDNIWTMLIFNPGSTAVKHTGYFSDDYSKVYDRHQDANLGQPPFPPDPVNRFIVGLPPATDSLVRGTTYYWCVDETDGNNVVWQGPVWSFYVQSYYATRPDPPNEAININPDVLLSWQPGYSEGIVAHDVYIGTSWEDVNNANEFDTTGIYQGWTVEPNWPCSGLAMDTKIYWRIDEVHDRIFPGSGTIYKDDVWSFTTVSGEATPLDPADGEVIEGEPYPEQPPYTHIWTMLIFEPGATAVKHTGYFSEDYSKVYNRHQDANLGEPPFPYPGWDNVYFAGNPEVDPATDSLVRGKTYYWCVDETDGNNVVWQGPVWSFYVQSYYATNPEPPNGATNIDTDVLLCWQAGSRVDDHDVYIGTSWEGVNNADDCDMTGIYQGYTIEPNYQCSNLAFNTRYYWRVDEVKWRIFPASPEIYKGDVWSFTTAPQRLFVDIDAAGANNGTSWENAYNYLQDALIEADSALKPVEIRVAKGIYKPDRSTADPNGSGDRMATFQLINGVTLQGGYAGYGELDPDARDIEAYETILSGDLAGNDVDVNDPCDLLTEPTRDENSYHVVTGSGTDETSILDGFIITGGNANGSKPNNLGGAMYNNSGSPTVFNCTFSGNTAVWWGGGMCNYSDSSPMLVKCTFSSNSAGYQGGGVYNYSNSNPVLTSCAFGGNYADWHGGGMYNYINSSPTLTNCTFSGNAARGVGGGMANEQESSPILTGCTFSRNSSGSKAGGMYNINFSSPVLTNCTFAGNYTNGRGGGIGNRASNPRIKNCMFSGNNAYYGGAMYSDSGSSPMLTNCTFSDNSAVFGGGMYNVGDGDPILTNCILWGDMPDEIWNNDGSTITIVYSDVQGSWPGLGNIDADPCFADPCIGDYHLKSQAGRWEPNSKSWVLDDDTSPCIDAGNPGCPLGDEPEPNGNRRNMGTYGGTAEASKSPAYWRSIADITNDWRVDFNDLKIFADYWLETGECIPGDLNRNKSVDFADFALAALHWQEDNNPKRYCVVEDDVEYCIRTDKSVYHLGETVEILYRITNLGSVPVSLGWVPMPPFCYHFVIVDNNGEHVWQWSWVMPPIPPVEFILDAYESKEYEIGWDMINDNGTYETGDDFPIGPGMYKITGELLTGSEEYRVKVSVSVHVRE